MVTETPDNLDSRTITLTKRYLYDELVLLCGSRSIRFARIRVLRTPRGAGLTVRTHKTKNFKSKSETSEREERSHETTFGGSGRYVHAALLRDKRDSYKRASSFAACVRFCVYFLSRHPAFPGDTRRVQRFRSRNSTR